MKKFKEYLKESLGVIKPNTIGILEPNDRFKFEGDNDVYYFVIHAHNYVCWNDTKKERKILELNSRSAYDQIIVHKI